MVLNKRDKSSLAVGSILAFFILLYSFVLYPLMESQDQVRRKLIKAKGLIEKYRAIALDKEMQNNRINKLKAIINDFDQQLLSGNKPALAAADLQSIMQKMAKDLGIEINSIKVSQFKQMGIFNEIPIELQISSSMRKLRDFLYHIENNSKFLTIPRIKVKVINLKKPRIIEARFIIIGYIKNTEI